MVAPVIPGEAPTRAQTETAATVRGEIDPASLRSLDRTGLLDGVDRIVVWDIAMTTRFRGITRRDGLLIHGPSGWGEAAPFWNYGPDASAPWLAAALELATGPGLAGLARHRETVPVNLTVPELPADAARALAAASGATTAKVKVAGHRAGRRADGRSTLREDLERLEAVRDALGPSARIRIDANGAWDLDRATRDLPEMDRAAGGLEYAEQPCATTEELAALRRKAGVPIAADEAIRLSDDPLAVTRLEAADVAVLKAAPLGGVRRALALSERLGLPAVVSSALDTSVGIGAGLALAAALPDLDHACGLGTLSLFRRDVAVPSLRPVAGSMPVRPVHVSRHVLPACAADDAVTESWTTRLGHMVGALAARREHERRDPASAVAGLPL